MHRAMPGQELFEAGVGRELLGQLAGSEVAGQMVLQPTSELLPETFLAGGVAEIHG